MAFKPIVEPFDPGHAARTRPGGKNCSSKSSTADIELCLEVAVENTDARIDGVREAAYTSADPATQHQVNADDMLWLQQRAPICEEFYNSGGTIDGVNIGSCLLDESTARLAALRGATQQPVQLQASDDPSMQGGVQFYTAGDGTRIAAVHSQGDQHGGAVVDWIIIGGYRGFTVKASAFRFTDGQFTDPGVPQGRVPTSARPGHRVDLSIDYTQLAKDPNASKKSGRFDYAPDGHVEAEFR
ncbi:MAG TPA: lysozyme inhibitor LprI family protein [Mycobacteriales bacterium]|nr:lysozyme inhibitor LprI family protein [Mycobacteriales bacterium]